MEKHAAICIGCMAEKEENGECSQCGYRESEIPPALYLKPSTILNNRYLIGRILSHNGEGALYLGYDTEKGMKITVKEYLPDTLCMRSHDTEIVTVKPEWLPLYKTYLSEFIDLNQKLTGGDVPQRIQRVLEVFTCNNTAYAVFEYIQGLSLKAYLAGIGGMTSWAEAKEMFRIVLSSLNILHYNGVIHRGISPSTLLVNEKLELYVIGFDIAASRTYGSETDFHIEPGYSAPELYNSSSRQGSWTDVYSICAVLYKMLTGMQPPCATERLKNDTLAEPILHNRDIPPNVSKTIMHGLAVDPERRIHSISELVSRIFKLPSVDDVTRDINLSHIHGYTEGVSKQKSTPNHARKKHRSSSSLVYTVGVLLCVAVIGCIIAMVYPLSGQSGRKPEETSATRPAYSQTTAPIVQTTKTTEAEPHTETERPSNEPLYKIPAFTSRIYELIVENSGYKFLKIVPVYEYNSEYAAGIIFEQDIEEGTEVVSGTEIKLKVSRGDGLVELPDYENTDISDYKAKLSALDIKYEVWKEFSSTVAEGQVTRCSAQVGEKINVQAGEVIKVYYSRGDSLDS